MKKNFIIHPIGFIQKDKESTILQLSKKYNKALKHLDKFSHCIIFSYNNKVIMHNVSRIIHLNLNDGIIALDKTAINNHEEVFDIKPYFPCEDKIIIPDNNKSRKEITKTFNSTKTYNTTEIVLTKKIEITPKATFNNIHSNHVITIHDKKLTNIIAKNKYLKVIWWFGRFDSNQFRRTLTTKPPYENAPECGIFATRSPVRPNPIACTIVKVNELIKNRITVSGFDGFNQTEIIDLISYNPEEDFVKNAVIPEWLDLWESHKSFTKKQNIPTDIILKKSGTNFFIESIIKEKIKYRPKEILTTKKFKNHDTISVKNAFENNLKNIDIDIPKNKITVITGVSGSGKSTLAFDTIYNESNRQFMSIMSNDLSLQQANVDQINGLIPAVAIGQKTPYLNPRSTVGTFSGISELLRQLYTNISTRHCENCHHGIDVLTKAEITKYIKLLKSDYKISPYGTTKPTDINTALKEGQGALHLNTNNKTYTLQTRLFCFNCGSMMFETIPGMFSSNNPDHMCQTCKGLGYETKIDIDLIIDKPELSILDGASCFWGNMKKFKEKPNANWMRGEVIALAIAHNVDLKLPYKDLPDTFKNELLYGNNGKKLTFKYKTSSGRGGYIEREAIGAVNTIKRLLIEGAPNSSNTIADRYTKKVPCTSCSGECLAPTGRLSEINGIRYPIAERMNITEFKDWLQNLELPKPKFLKVEMLIHKLIFQSNKIIDMGLGYLSLNRQIPTLSGGELRRVQLASQFGTNLTNMLYVLDEPTKGLHPSDHSKLMHKIKELRDKDNTIILVEHTREIINNADFIVDIGKGAGKYGGEIIAKGSVEEIKNNPNSITGKYLSQERSTTPKKINTDTTSSITLLGAKGHNLKNIDVTFPLGKFTCVTGVSGSGKSSLVADTLYPAIAKKLEQITKECLEYEEITGTENLNGVMLVSQKPIGRTPKSIPATYTGVFELIRNIFSRTDQAKALKYSKDYFTFNGKNGQCEVCNGLGQLKIPMNHMNDIWVTCSHCKGRRYKDEILQIKYKGHSIYDILELEVREALDLFRDDSKTTQILKMINKVGLSYLKLGQSAATLSGGEAQRLKLTKELCKGNSSGIVYILDEPTTGLHFADTERLTSILKDLLNTGNTVIAIEHNTDFIAEADHVIELGPCGGEKGGYLIQ